MKKIIAVLTLATTFISCESSSSCTKDQETCKKDEAKQEVTSDETLVGNINAFEENLAAFNSCKQTTTGKGKCKEYIAKAVCEYYGIEDLKDGSNYVDYDKIPKKLKELESWENIGNFDEENINTALEKLNNFGKPVLIFNEDASYVHVVALKPNGKSVKSGKWGNISVPACISYFPRRKDSFTEKGLNYAFKSADDLTIWTKK
jgi:hypothetical protein